MLNILLNAKLKNPININHPYMLDFWFIVSSEITHPYSLEAKLSVAIKNNRNNKQDLNLVIKQINKVIEDIDMILSNIVKKL